MNARTYWIRRGIESDNSVRPQCTKAHAFDRGGLNDHPDHAITDAQGHLFEELVILYWSRYATNLIVVRHLAR